jgi:hypothetical protein
MSFDKYGGRSRDKKRRGRKHKKWDGTTSKSTKSTTSSKSC